MILMKERILNYRKKIDELLKNNSDDTDWNKVMEEHLTQISFFQHERLVHLIVTVTVAVLLLMCIAVTLIADYLYMLLTAALFLVLLIPYISHYYLLENEVQKMYKQYDLIKEKL